MTRALKGLVGIGLLAIVASHVKAQCIVQEITAPPGGPSPNSFGVLATAGDVLVVGDGGDFRAAPGRAYVYRRVNDTWLHEATLHDPDASIATAFYRPATNGEVILVASPAADGAAKFSGAVHVWRHNGVDWVYETRLLAADGVSGDEFGFSLDIDGDAVLIGARDDAIEGFGDAGSAYVFRYDRTALQWRQEQKLSAFTPATFEKFGAHVDIADDLIIVGAPGVKQGRGAAYVFRHTGKRWVGEAELMAFDGQVDDRFGSGVYVGPAGAAAGAPKADTPVGTWLGATYTFQQVRGRWAFETKLYDERPIKPSQDFSGTVATAEGDVLLMASSDSFGAPLAGAAILYRRIDGQWTQTGKLGDPSPSFGGGFGHSVVNGDQAIIAALSGLPGGNGVVFVFDGIHQRDCDDDGVVDACEDVRGPDWPVTPMSCDVLADLDSDGFVGSSDIALMLTSWGLCPSGCAADLNADGMIDGYDLAFLLGFWGRVTD
jgi:hypothetical protein